MKKLMFSALACVAFAFSGFASNEVVNEEKFLDENNLIETEITASYTKENKVEFAQTCYYDIYYKGKKVGEVTVTDVPDNVSCDSEVAKANALDIYQKGLGLQK